MTDWYAGGFLNSNAPALVVASRRMPLPPFLDAAPDQPSLPNVSFDVHWTVQNTPDGVPKNWVQSFRDGVELPGARLSRARSALEFVCDYCDMVALVHGVLHVEDLGSRLEWRGALGVLSAWSALTECGFAPRRRTYNDHETHALVAWAHGLRKLDR